MQRAPTLDRLSFRTDVTCLGAALAIAVFAGVEQLRRIHMRDAYALVADVGATLAIAIAAAFFAATAITRGSGQSVGRYDADARAMLVCASLLFFAGVLFIAGARDHARLPLPALLTAAGFVATSLARRALRLRVEWLAGVASARVPGWSLLPAIDPDAGRGAFRSGRDALDGVLVTTSAPRSAHYRAYVSSRVVALAPFDVAEARQSVARTLKYSSAPVRLAAIVAAGITIASAPSIHVVGAGRSPGAAARQGSRYRSIVMAGDGTCALDAAGAVDCWTRGQGRTRVLTGVRSIAVGERHACAVLTDGSVQCWGANERAQLGDGSTAARHGPVRVVGMTGVTEVAVGGAHTCARTIDGRVWCWGANEYGQLGDGTNADRPRAVRTTLENVTTLAAGDAHTCALEGIGAQEVWCWGDNARGQLGDGTIRAHATPATVRGLRGMGRLAGSERIVASAAATCVRQDDGVVMCWGEVPGYPNATELVDLHPFTNVPVEITPLLGVDETHVVGDGRVRAIRAPGDEFWWITSDEVALGRDAGCVRTAARDVRCWSRATSMRPERVRGVDEAVRIGVGLREACALDAMGAIQCWSPDGAQAH